MRKLAAFALPFAAADLLAQYFLPAETRPVLGIICALWGLCALLLRGNGRLRLLLTAMGLSLGLLWSSAYELIFYAPSQQLVGEAVPFSAVAADYPVETAYGISLEVRLQLEGSPDCKAILYLDEKYNLLEPGDQLDGLADFRTASERRGELFTYYTAKGIYLIGSGAEELRIVRPEKTPLGCYPVILAHQMKQTVYALLPSEEAGFLSALLMGDKSGLSDSLSNALTRDGLAHMAAVSGMHISFLVGLLFCLTGGSRRSLRFCIPLLFFYMMAAGCTPSVVRACIMQAVLLLAPALRRENDPPTALSFALLLLLLQNPRCIASVSLQLSFCAVAGILCFTRRLSRWFERPFAKRERGTPVWVRFLSGSLATTLGAAAFTLPLTVFYFGALSLIAPLANLLAAEWVALAFGGGLVVTALGLFWLPAAQVLIVPVRWLLTGLIWLIRRLAALPYAALQTDGFYVRVWLLYLAVVLVLLWALPALRKRPLIPLSGVVCLLCLVLVLERQAVMGTELTAQVLDVGEGQSVLLLSQGAAAAVDCGGNGDNGGDVLADALQRIGKSQLELLILTHYDEDHINGLEELLERIAVKQIALPASAAGSAGRETVLALAQRYGVEQVWVDSLQYWEFGEAELTLFPPFGEAGNEGCLAVLCSAGQFDLLLTGDMDAEYEERLVEEYDLPDIEVLIVGHHGSKTSTGAALLEAVKPETAVISVGYNNYGHPAPEVLLRLEAAGAEIYRTDRQGAVTVSVYG